MNRKNWGRGFQAWGWELGYEGCTGDRKKNVELGMHGQVTWTPTTFSQANFFYKFFCYRDHKTFWFSIFVMFSISAYWMITNFTAFIFIYLLFVFLVLLCSPCWPRIYRLVCWSSLKLHHSSCICFLIAGITSICHQVFSVTCYLSNSAQGVINVCFAACMPVPCVCLVLMEVRRGCQLD